MTQGKTASPEAGVFDQALLLDAFEQADQVALDEYLLGQRLVATQLHTGTEQNAIASYYPSGEAVLRGLNKLFKWDADRKYHTLSYEMQARGRVAEVDLPSRSLILEPILPLTYLNDCHSIVRLIDADGQPLVSLEFLRRRR